MASSTSALAATATTSDFGRLQSGETVQAITLANSHGVKAKILAFGATLQSLIVPDRNGHPADVVLGFDDLTDMFTRPPTSAPASGATPTASPTASSRSTARHISWRRTTGLTPSTAA
jgi:hypothetical protein